MMKEQAIAPEDSELSAPSSAYSGSQGQKAVGTALGLILGPVSELSLFSQEIPSFR